MSAGLRIVAPLQNVSGYAKAGRALVSAAIRAGYDVEAHEIERMRLVTVRADGSVDRAVAPRYRTPIPTAQAEELGTALGHRVSEEAPTLIMGNPFALSEWGEFSLAPRIGLTMWEADGLNLGWARSCENVDLLLLPSVWNLETARASVRRPRCEVFPLGVDERCWSPFGARRRVKNRPEFLFVSVFSTCERKNWRTLLQAFAEEFRGENVGLLAKPSRIAEVEELAGWCRSMGAWVEVVSERLSEEEMGDLYRGADAYVLPSAEGFGLPFVEAAMCGVPSLGLDSGGAKDPLAALGGGFIQATDVSCIGLLPQYYGSDQSFPSCSVADLRRAFRQFYEQTISGKVFSGAELAKLAVREFGLEVTAKRLRAAVSLASRSETVTGVRGEAASLAAIITTHNHLDRTQACVRALREAGGAAHIVLADDGSCDGTRAWAAQEGLDCLALAGGNVSANRQAAVDFLRDRYHWEGYLLFLDNDVEVSHGFWDTLFSCFCTNDDLGVLAPRKVFGDGRLQNAGNRLLSHGGSMPCLLERDLNWIDYVESACMAVRPEVWRRVRWDAGFPIFYEDADYCFQARALGYEIGATSLATVTHHAHTTSGARSGEAETMRKRFVQKWKERL